MPMQVHPGHAALPGMTAERSGRQGQIRSAAGQEGQADKVTELQNKRQMLQDQILLLKAAGTDGADMSADTREVLEEQLERVTAELRAAKADRVQAAGQAGRPISAERSRDRYEPDRDGTVSPGIYRVEEDEEQGYRILFSPYPED